MSSAKNKVFISESLNSFEDLAISKPECVESINLHLNNFTSLESLKIFTNLEHLDISSNQLQSLNGLDDLVNLKTANFACNYLKTVNFVSKLLFLTHINLSYNKLSSLNGFLELHGNSSCLKVIKLYGNCLSSSNHVIQCLNGILSLQHLLLSWKSESNPLCSQTNYRNILLDGLPQLLSLDSVDRQDSIIDIDSDEKSFVSRVIDNLMDLPQRDSTDLEISTPNIDAIINKRKKSKLNQKSRLLKNTNNGYVEKQNSVFKDKSNLLHEESDSFNSLKSETDEELKSNQKSDDKINKKMKKSKIPILKVDKHEHGDGAEVKNILNDLQIERERRCKAESACKKLVSDLNRNKFEKEETSNMREIATETAERLREMVIHLQNSNEMLTIELQKQTNKAVKLNSDEKKYSKYVEEAEENMKLYKNQITKLKEENGIMKQKLQKKLKIKDEKLLEVTKAYQESSLQSEAFKAKINHLEKKILEDQLEYKKLNKGMFSKDSVEFQNALSLRINREEKRHQQEITHLQKEINISHRQYKDLENEFREALVIESERFNNINNKYLVIEAEYSKAKSTLDIFQSQDCNSKSLVLELSNVVKEQKTRIEEIEKSKNQFLQQNKELLAKLDIKNEESKEKSVQNEMLKKDKSKFFAQVTSLQSLIDGMKEEKKLWGFELAQQSSSLAKDRGRLEMKIESLKAELSSLRKTNEKDLDLLRIKTKVVEDQTETIRRMKEALTTKDVEIKSKLESQLDVEKVLREDLQGMEDEVNHLQAEVENVTTRKEEYKNRLLRLTNDFTEISEENNHLKTKWENTTKVLTKLEIEMKKISESHHQKEMKLKHEKDEAFKALRVMNTKMNNIDAEIEKQLEIANQAHLEEMKSFERNKQQEISHLQMKVDAVENEMKILLLEKRDDKKRMEAKMEKLKHAFQDVQSF